MRNTFDIGKATDSGKRNYQQDSLGILEEKDGSILVALADGMGGHNGGDIASKYAVKAFGKYFKQPLDKDTPSQLYDALHYANREVCKMAKKNPAIGDMCSTLIGLFLKNKEAYWISVGDSLLYRIRDKRLEKLNKEHTLISHFKKLYTAGKISQQELDAINDPHAITSSIGMEDLTEIDNSSTPVDLQFGDYLIIASDGLLTLSEQEIVNLVVSAKSSQDAADNLINKIKILDTVSQDNVTVIVVKILGSKKSYLKIVPININWLKAAIVICSILVPGLLFYGYQFTIKPEVATEETKPTTPVTNNTIPVNPITDSSSGAKQPATPVLKNTETNNTAKEKNKSSPTSPSPKPAGQVGKNDSKNNIKNSPKSSDEKHQTTNVKDAPLPTGTHPSTTSDSSEKTSDSDKDGSTTEKEKKDDKQNQTNPPVETKPSSNPVETTPQQSSPQENQATIKGLGIINT